ncbi:MAG: hypothetical protein KC560_16130 [Myxococcales bacterium]|nr:hypothetical protein [Myxococcales bacterium]
MSVRIENDRLVFPSGLAIEFQRTLRIPDDSRDHPLPAGFGPFPLRRVDDYAAAVPEDWRRRGGVFLPMYQREALWISFDASGSAAPSAVQVGAGMVCALTGAPWSSTLHAHPQNYVVTPPQPWLDGIAVARGRIRQFVAMPLGSGTTVEAQITGEERNGGIQLQVFDLKPEARPRRPRLRKRGMVGDVQYAQLMCAEAPPSMGLAAGGGMRQKIYRDPHGIDAWDSAPGRAARVWVHIAPAHLWERLTGEPTPRTPISAEEYARHGIPWFDLYDERLAAIDGGEPLRGVRSLGELEAARAGSDWRGTTARGDVVRDGDWSRD